MKECGFIGGEEEGQFHIKTGAQKSRTETHMAEQDKIKQTNI